MSNLERCPLCAGARAKEDWDAASNCHGCAGKGFRRLPKSYVCNRCGGSMCPYAGTPNDEIPHGLVEAKVSGGYDSFHLFDGTTYVFSLCELCLRELFLTFKVKPLAADYIGGHPDWDYEADERAYRIRVWQKAGGHIEKLATGLCNETPECQNPATLRHFVSGYMTDEAFCAEHSPNRTFGNSRWIDEALCRDIPLKAEDRNEYQKQRLIEAFMSSLSVVRPTFFRYVSDTVRDVVGCVEETGGIWLPQAVAEPAWLTEALAKREVTALILANGRLYYGPDTGVSRLGARYAEELDRAV